MSSLRERFHLQLLAAALLASAPPRQAETVCAHEEDPAVRMSKEIRDGETIYRDLRFNQTDRYFYSNFNYSHWNQPDKFRKLIINLEPCQGIIYLFVRKTRRCWPNPYSCIDLTPGKEKRNPSECEWTHFMSEIDGSRDGAPTFFEIPLTSTKYYISVFAAMNSAYTLTVLDDIGAFPRPGGVNKGEIVARQLQELQVQLSWDTATFAPSGTSTIKQYWIYSAMLLKDDNRTNTAIFLRPTKVMNTVCGLKNNTDKEYDRLPASMCRNGKCNHTIEGLISEKRYIFNVVAESDAGFFMAYAGLIMRTDWQIVTQAASDKTLKVVGAVSGSVLGMVIIGYLWMIKLYG